MFWASGAKRLAEAMWTRNVTYQYEAWNSSLHFLRLSRADSPIPVGASSDFPFFVVAVLGRLTTIGRLVPSSIS